MLLPDLISVIMFTREPLQPRTQRAIRHLEASGGVQYELILINRNYRWTTGTAANQGFGAAVGGYIVFCCDDCFVDPEALRHMRDAFQDPLVGIAGALLRYQDGTVQHAGGHISCEPMLGRDRVSLTVSHIAHHEPMRAFASQDVPFVTGALMMTRRDVIDKIGGYDERCELDWGDVDFCLRAGQAGYHVRFVAEATAVHLEASTRGGRTGRTDWFFERWGPAMLDGSLDERMIQCQV